MNPKPRHLNLLWALLLGLILAACNGTTTPTQSPVDATLTATVPELVFTDTPVAIATEQVFSSIQAEMVLWAAPGADAQRAEQLAQGLTAYAAENGLRFVQRDVVNALELAEPVRLVVALAPTAELSAMAAAAPGVQFLGLDNNDLSVGGNLNVVLSSAAGLEEQAFMAAYLLAMTTADYRVGVISQAGTEIGLRTQESFGVGARYYCGLCGARFGPVLYYPRFAQISDPNNPGDWQAAADALLLDSVRAVYLQAEISSPELVQYLQAAGVALLGTPGQVGSSWIAVLGANPVETALNQIPRLLAGEGIGSVSTGLELTQVNSAYISEGRLILYESTLRDLQAGLIRTTPVK